MLINDRAINMNSSCLRDYVKGNMQQGQINLKIVTIALGLLYRLNEKERLI